MDSSAEAEVLKARLSPGHVPERDGWAEEEAQRSWLSWFRARPQPNW